GSRPRLPAHRLTPLLAPAPARARASCPLAPAPARAPRELPARGSHAASLEGCLASYIDVESPRTRRSGAHDDDEAGEPGKSAGVPPPIADRCSGRGRCCGTAG